MRILSGTRVCFSPAFISISALLRKICIITQCGGSTAWSRYTTRISNNQAKAVRKFLKHNVGVAGRRTVAANTWMGRALLFLPLQRKLLRQHLSSIVLLSSSLVFVFFFSLYSVSFPLPSISTVINAFHSLRLHYVTLSHYTQKEIPNRQVPHLVSCTCHRQILQL